MECTIFLFICTILHTFASESEKTVLFSPKTAKRRAQMTGPPGKYAFSLGNYSSK